MYLLVMLAQSEDELQRSPGLLRRRPQSTSLGTSGTRSSPLSTPDGGRGPSPAGLSRESTGLSAVSIERASGEDAENCRGVGRLMSGHNHRHPSRASPTPTHLVRQAWMVVWAITSGALIVILGWMGLTLVMSEHLGGSAGGVAGDGAPAGAGPRRRRVVPVVVRPGPGRGRRHLRLRRRLPERHRRATCSAPPWSTLLTAVQAGSVGMALLLAVLYLVYGFFVLYVIVQMVLRLALIDILLALAPIALGLWILPHTAGWGRHWLRLFMTTTFQQAIQLIALAMGFAFLNEVAAIAAFEPVQDLIWKLLMSLAFIYMATRVPLVAGQRRDLR